MRSYKPWNDFVLQVTNEQQDIYVLYVLSQASVHGLSQLKPKKSGVGPYTENLLEHLN